MAVLLSWKNDRIGKLVAALPFPYCAYHDALRNAWSHPEDRPADLTRQIVLECTPPRVGDLLRALREHVDVAVPGEPRQGR